MEVIIRGQPGAYVGLSGLDAAFYSMQAGNEISYGEVKEKVSQNFWKQLQCKY